MEEDLLEIIHKIRTPTMAIQSSSQGIKDYLPRLVAVYQEAKRYHINVPEISEDILIILAKVVSNIEKEASFINAYLDGLTNHKKGSIK
jgi:hypothetical protein